MDGKSNTSVISYVISGILAVAVIVLFILFFTAKPSGGATGKPPMQTRTVTLEDGTVVEQEVAPLLPIAYIQVDSIFNQYGFFLDQNAALNDKYTSEMNTHQSTERRIQQDANKLQQDMQNNRYLTQSEVEQKSISLQRRFEDLQRQASQTEQDYMIKGQELNVQLVDSIKNAANVVNETNRYQLIFLNQGLSTILYADKSYDLTEEILTFLNSRYTAQ